MARGMHLKRRGEMRIADFKSIMDFKRVCGEKSPELSGVQQAARKRDDAHDNFAAEVVLLLTSAKRRLFAALV